MRRKLRRKAAKGGGKRGGKFPKKEFEIAVERYRRGRLAEAQEILLGLQRVCPGAYDVLHLLAIIAMQTDRCAHAIEYLEEAISIVPDSAELYDLLGGALQYEGRLEEAIDALEKALSIEPRFSAYCILGNAFRGLGRLEDAAASYRKAIKMNPDIAEGHNNLGDILRELKRREEAIASFQKALAINPDYADAHNNLGVALKDLGRLDEAVASYRKALAINPDFAEAHSNLGSVFRDQRKLDDAVVNFHKALAINPDYAEAHSNLGNALNDLGRLDEAVASYQKALAIKPDYAEAHNNIGGALKELGRFDDALDSYNKALAIDPDYAEAYHGLGLLQLLTGGFQGGWENFNWRWRLERNASNFEKHANYGKPLWRGEAPDGKRLLLWEEQGVGESIIFASMIPDLAERGADIILECDKRLIPLYSRSFPAITCLAKDKTLKGKPADKEFDFHAPLGNLGSLLRPDLSHFSDRPSYLKAGAGQRSALRGRYLKQGNDFLAGVAWRSKSLNYGEQKSMTLHDLRPLLETPGVTFIDLQYGDTAEERKSFTAETGIDIIHDDGVDQMADLDIFASQVAAMDMVVTISNTTAHMAGALGVPALLMLGTVPIWYWMLEREDCPWYPSLRLFRQRQRGDWRGVAERVREELAGRI